MKNINKFNQEIGTHVKNWCPAKFQTQQIHTGRYCNLEPLNKDKHAKTLFDILHAHSEEQWTYLPYGPFRSLRDFETWISNSLEEKDSFFYAILDKKTSQPLGICAYLRINPEHGVIEVGHLHFSYLLQKKPAATEAMYMMMKQAFDLGYRRYEWKCHSMNKPSWRAAERLGFTFEGIFRQHLVIKEHNRDTAWFSILDGEWPALKIKLERWLEPHNFDEEKKQILKLKDICVER